MADDNEIDKRVRSLEYKFWAAAGAAAILAVWIGATNVYSVPKAALDAISSTAAKTAGDEIQKLRDKAEKDEAKITDLASRKTITLDGACFTPMTLTRCFHGPDHMTWVDDETECKNAGYAVEGKMTVLVECQ